MFGNKTPRIAKNKTHFENNSEAQIVPKVKNNGPRSKFSGSYKKESVYFIRIRMFEMEVTLLQM